MVVINLEKEIVKVKLVSLKKDFGEIEEPSRIDGIEGDLTSEGSESFYCASLNKFKKVIMQRI